MKILTIILTFFPCLVFSQTDNKTKILGGWQLYPNNPTNDTLTFIRPAILTENKISLNPDTHWNIKEGGEMTVGNTFSNRHTTDGIIDGKDMKDTTWTETINGVTTYHALKAPLILDGATSTITYWNLTADGKTLTVASFDNYNTYEIIYLEKTHLKLKNLTLQILVDSLKFVKNMPYICRDTVPTELSVGCGDKIFWRAVKQKQDIIPFLIEKLSDTTQTSATVPNFGGQYTVADIAYAALQEIIKDIPTFELLGVKFDKNGCGYCSYWNHLQKDIKNRKKFQANVRKWYDQNKSNLVWVTSNQFLTCDCAGRHPNGGHYELKK